MKTIQPEKSQITGVQYLKRAVFTDKRGLLVETYSSLKEKDPSVYAYVSFTKPGQARDKDQFHFHRFQKDRFTVVKGRLWVILFDQRKKSKTFNRLEVVELKADGKTTGTLMIPIGVYHGLKNPGPGWAVLVNHPTKVYNPKDEGRVAFDQVKIQKTGYFSWGLVK